MSLMRRTFLPMLIAVMALLGACKDKQEAQPEIEKPVKVVTIGDDLLTKPRIYPGTVKANQSVDMAFQVAGQITNMPIALGQEIEKGGLIASLDDRDFQNSLNVAKAQLNQAELQYNRLKTLVENGTVARSKFDEAQAAFDVANAQYEIAQKALDDTKLLAPYTGRVAQKYVDNYENIQAKQPIISLQAIHFVDIEVDIPEQDMIQAGKRQRNEQLRPGDVVVFSSLPNREFSVKLKEWSTEADPKTQTYRVVLTMEAPQDVNIFPGMSASFILRSPIASSGITIKVPSQSVLVDEQGHFYVWVVSDNLTLEKRQVEVGQLVEGQIEIKEGVTLGEKIISAGASLVHKDMKIKIYEGN